jgi:hypothetical protein
LDTDYQQKCLEKLRCGSRMTQPGSSASQREQRKRKPFGSFQSVFAQRGHGSSTRTPGPIVRPRGMRHVKYAKTSPATGDMSVKNASVRGAGEGGGGTGVGISLFKQALNDISIDINDL